MVKSINYFREAGTIKDIPPNEKEQYIEFLSITYRDNLSASEFLLITKIRCSALSPT